MLNKKAIAKTIAVDRDRVKRTGGPFIESTNYMTVNGAVTKTAILTMIMLTVAVTTYSIPSQMFMTIGALGGAAVYFLTSFKPNLAPITAPIYAVLKGLLVGSASAFFAFAHNGIVLQAAGATMICLLVMLFLYRTGIVKVTQKFRMIVSMCVGAIMIIYLLSWIGSLTGTFEIPYLHSNGPIGIGVTVVILIVAALNLLLNFDSFEKGEDMQAAKHYEWYFGMGLLFTLVWIYLEFLRLISKIQSD